MTDANERTDASPFAGESPGTRERIMQATYDVMQEHGFAGLSISRIAERADLSKSSVYHFYDDKDDLLLAFLDMMLDRFGAPLEDVDRDQPVDALWAHLDFALSGVGAGSLPPFDGDRIDVESGRPYVELRSQATYDASYREKFSGIDTTMRDRLTMIIGQGIERGDFKDVDAIQMAEFLLTVMLGGMFRRATSDELDMEAVRDEVKSVIESQLLTES